MKTIIAAFALLILTVPTVEVRVRDYQADPSVTNTRERRTERIVAAERQNAEREIAKLLQDQRRVEIETAFARRQAARSSELAAPDISEDVLVKGTLSGAGDLNIAGRVEGKIEIGGTVRIMSGAAIIAPIVASEVIVGGSVRGNVIGTERVIVRSSGSIDGDIRSPRIVIEEGAAVRGRLDVCSPQSSVTRQPARSGGPDAGCPVLVHPTKTTASLTSEKP